MQMLMNKGSIEQVGTPEEIYERPATVYVAGFIGSPAMNFLPGRIADSRSAVTLDTGATLALPPGLHGQAAAGTLVQIGLRPEQLAIGPAAGAPLAARFDFAEELGSGREYHLSVEDIPVTVLSADKLALSANESVGLTFAPAALHLFDGATGRRITARTVGRLAEAVA